MTKKYKYCVIIPAYNVENKIHIMIDSIIDARKKYDNFNVVIVNDGSTDRTLDVCEKYANTYKYITVLNQKNSGANYARKNGFVNSDSEYVLFYDADDYIEENTFFIIDEEIKKGDYDVIEFGYNKVNPKTRVSSKIILNVKLINGNVIKYFLSSKNTRNYLWNKVFKRTLIDEKDFFPFAYGEDFLLLTRIFSKCKNLKVSNEIVYNYMIYDDSVCSIKYSSKHLDILKVNNNVYEFLSNENKELLGYSSLIACSSAAKLYTCAKFTKKGTSSEKKMIIENFKKYYTVFLENRNKMFFDDISKNKILSVIIFNLSPELYYILFRKKLLKRQ